MALRVRVKQMVSARIVLIDAFLDETHAQDARIEIQILLRGACDRGDVV